MPSRKLKPVEANDGSYAGMVLAAYDRLPDPAPAIPPDSAWQPDADAFLRATRESQGQPADAEPRAARPVPTKLSRILDTLAALDVRLPLRRSADDPCTASGPDGRPVFTVDVNSDLPDEDAIQITELLIELVNAAGERATAAGRASDGTPGVVARPAGAPAGEACDAAREA